MAVILDRVAVRRGAAGVLMFVVPAYVIAAVAASGDSASPAWLLLAAALLFGATFGGYVGARDRPATPMAHGAASAGFGLGVVFVGAFAVQLIRGHLTLNAVLTAIVMLQIGVALGCLGGVLAAKGMRPTTARTGASAARGPSGREDGGPAGCPPGKE
ncbi:MAG: hypothetical protein H0U92_04075 [Actinobacteria bacterium]|nr:hypothetical protein [Actinomycetota bacterium]